MMTSPSIDLRPSNRLLYVGIAVLLGLSTAVQAVRDRGWAPYAPPNPALWLQSGALAKKLSLGFENLVADVYWMRTLNYYGGRRQLSSGEQSAAAQATNFDNLDPLLNLVTSLDPHFKLAYRFGAIFLAEAYPSGPGRPDLAVALLQRGIENDSARWEYMEDIGFVYYWTINDYEKAAEWFKKAGEQPGAPAWLQPLAATTLAQGGDRQSARFLWTQLSQQTDIDWLRANAAIRLKQLDAMDVIDRLNQLGPRVRGVPLDPAGVPYVRDPVTGRFDVDRRSPLFPLAWQAAPTPRQ